MIVPNGSWLFPLVHVGSTTLQALFCTSCVVLVYQLCLRWFGRERLEAIMVTAQVVISIAAVLGGQLLPQLLAREGSMTSMAANAWWIGLVPPAWFAGIDDALAGSGAASSWLLAGIAVAGTAAVVWLAFGKLADSYEAGLQTLNERTGDAKRKQTGRWLHTLVERPPLRWWLRDPVVRASFLLTAAYLLRDRETKLRVYPGVAPFLVVADDVHVRFARTGGGKWLRDGGGERLLVAGADVGGEHAVLLATLAGGRHLSRRADRRAGTALQRRAAGGALLFGGAVDAGVRWRGVGDGRAELAVAAASAGADRHAGVRDDAEFGRAGGAALAARRRCEVGDARVCR